MEKFERTPKVKDGSKKLENDVNLLKDEIFELKREIEELKYFNRVLSCKLRELPDF